MLKETRNPVAEYFDGRAPQWDKHGEASGPKHASVAHIAGARAGSRVLDLGCGTGVMVPAYLEAGADTVLGVDLSAEMIARAREKFKGEPSVRFECGDTLDLDCEGSFDCAVIYNAYPHFLDKENLVKKVAALLAPQGRFLVAHGMSRHAMNAHHKHVPSEVTSTLREALKEASLWSTLFEIDTVCDNDFFYCFGGKLLAAE